MPATVVVPTATHLMEVFASRTDGPSCWTMDEQSRCDRVRAAITNAGFGLPTGEVTVWFSERATGSGLDLAVALAVMLAEPSHRHLRRPGWMAWGAVGLDGSLAPVDGDFVNDLPPGPYVGRIWEPDDRLPSPDQDAVISLVDVAELSRAWDVITFFAEAEEVIVGNGAHVVPTGTQRERSVLNGA